MFFGGGNAMFFGDATSATGLRELLRINPSTLSITGAGESVEALGVPWEPAVAQVLASAETSQTFTGTLNVQKIGLAEMMAILGTKSYTPNINVPTPFQATISSNAVTVTGLAEDEIVVVNVTTEGKQQPLTQIAASDTPSAGEFEVTADTITFNTGEFTDGTVVTGLSYDTVSTGSMIGGNSTSASYGNLSFFCKLKNTEYTGDVLFYAKQLKISTDFDLGLIGSAGDDVSIPVTLTTPDDWNRPYALIFPAA